MTALFATLLIAGASTALAASDNATTNEGFTQGLQKGGGTVDILRSDPSDALGAADGEFVSLGYGGELIVGFDQNMSGNLMLTVQEVTGAAYPLETADVYVSTDSAGPWTYVGEASNEEGADDGATMLEVAECYQFVRLMDTTDSALHDDSSDGFDIDSFTADYDETCPVVEEPEDDMPSSVNISLHSGAMVMNDTETAANTGGNMADGSYAGSGGNGGDIENSDGDQDVENGATGNGGNGGNAGLGGAVQTGDALAEGSITNTINSNVVEINDCECESVTDRVRIRTHDFAFLANRTRTAANTGNNAALGSYAGEGGDGGDIENGDDDRRDRGGPQSLNGPDGGNNGNDGSQEVDDSTTGTGGTGGNATDGGAVVTGASTARSTIANIVNRNTIRVR